MPSLGLLAFGADMLIECEGCCVVWWKSVDGCLAWSKLVMQGRRRSAGRGLFMPSSLFTRNHDVRSRLLILDRTFHCSGACGLHMAAAAPPHAPSASSYVRHILAGAIQVIRQSRGWLCWQTRPTSKATCWQVRNHENLPEPSLQQHAIRYHVLDIIRNIISHK